MKPKPDRCGMVLACSWTLITYCTGLALGWRWRSRALSIIANHARRATPS